jgi:hypothetical protein
VQKGKRAQAMIQRWRIQALVPAFDHWKAWSRQHRQHRLQLLTTMLNRLVNKNVWVAWRQWGQQCEDMALQELKSKLSAQKAKQGMQLIKSWRMRAIVPCFKSWKQWAKEHKVYREAVQRKTFTRMVNASVWGVWRQWQLSVEDAKLAAMREILEGQEGSLAAHRAKRVQLMVHKWKYASQTQAFHRWRAWARETRAHKRELLTTTMTRMVHHEYYGVWRVWTSLVETQRVQELTDAVNSQKHARAGAMILRWRLQSMAPCFAAWRQWASEQVQRKTFLFSSTITRMCNASLWQTWRSWTQTVQEEKGEEEKRQWALTRRMSFDGKMEDMRASFEAQLQAEVQRNAKSLMTRVLHRMINHKLWRVYRTWHMWMEDQREQEHQYNLMHKILNRLINHAVYAPFRQWCDHVEDHKLHEMQQSLVQRRMSFDAKKQNMRLEIEEMEARNTARILRKSLNRLRNGALWRCFRTWTQTVQEDREEEERMQWTVLRRGSFDAKLRDAHSGFEAELQKQREKSAYALMKKMMHRMVNASLWQSWRDWHGIVEQAKLLKLQAALKEQQGNLSTMRLELSETQARAAEGQKNMQKTTYVELITRFSRLQQKRPQQSMHILCFYSLRVVVLQTKLKHALTLAAQAKGAAREAALNDAREAQAKLSETSKMTRAVLFRTNAVLCGAFRKWFEFHRIGKQRTHALRRLMDREQTRRLRTGLAQWALYAQRQAGIADEAMQRKIELLVAEVNERGHHIQYLVEENKKLAHTSPVKEPRASATATAGSFLGRSSTQAPAYDAGRTNTSSSLTDYGSVFQATTTSLLSPVRESPEKSLYGSRYEPQGSGLRSVRGGAYSPVRDTHTHTQMEFDGREWPDANNFFGWKDGDRTFSNTRRATDIPNNTSEYFTRTNISDKGGSSRRRYS